jgi:hypothetical protein
MNLEHFFEEEEGGTRMRGCRRGGGRGQNGGGGRDFISKKTTTRAHREGGRSPSVLPKKTLLPKSTPTAFAFGTCTGDRASFPLFLMISMVAISHVPLYCARSTPPFHQPPTPSHHHIKGVLKRK